MSTPGIFYKKFSVFIFNVMVMMTLTLMLSSYTQAQSTNLHESISLQEFNRLKSIFVKTGCNIEGVLSSSKKFNVSDRWSYLLDSEEGKLNDLPKSSLCLISRSADFNVYSKNFTVETKATKGISWWENQFPTGKQITKIEFYLPPKYHKQCNGPEGDASPYIIRYTKSHGKINRQIFSNENADEDCIIKSMKLPIQ